MSTKYLYIFLHVPKTAGTTLNFHALKNLSAEEVLDLTSLKPDLNTNKYMKNLYKPGFVKKSVDMIIESISGKALDKKILICDSHFAYYGIHKYFNREPRYFTFVRNPAARVISIYNYLSTLYNLEDRHGKDKKIYHRLLLVDCKYP